MPSTDETPWDHEVDVLIGGSGAGGMVASIAARGFGLTALVVEKAATFGGSTALSGGGIWILNNPTLREAGRVDDPEDVRRYLHAVVGDRVPAERIDTYVDRGPEVMEMLHRVSRHMDFSWCPGYSDYHPELPGGSAAGRTIEPRPIDVRKLGDEEQQLLGMDIPMPLGLWFTGYEARNLMFRRGLARGVQLLPPPSYEGARLRARRAAPAGHARPRPPVVDERAGHRADHRGGPGRGGGRRARRQAPVGPRAVRGPAGDRRLRARPGPAQAAPPRARPARLQCRCALQHGRRAPLRRRARRRPRPDGRRLVDAVDLAAPRGRLPAGVGALHSRHGHRRQRREAGHQRGVTVCQLRARPHVPAYEIFGGKARARYQFAGILPGRDFPRSFYRSGLVTKANSLRELALAIGVPAEALEETVTRFNGFAAKGKDGDYGRGDSP